MNGLGNARNVNVALKKGLTIAANEVVLAPPAAMTAREISDLGVHLDGSRHDEGRIVFAEMVATIFGARVEGCLTNVIPTAPIPAGPGSGWLEAEFWKNGREAGDKIELRLRDRIARIDADNEVLRYDGMTFEVISSVARRARVLDLMVLGRPFGGERQWPEFVDAVLFEAGATAMIVPPEMDRFADPQTILIGWKDTVESSRAIAASLPFLKRARQVFLTTVDEGSPDEERRLEPAADMAAHLARHGVSVEVRHLPDWSVASEGILNEAKAVGADLVVVGAYGRSRLREIILGGVTRDLLTESTVPLLMSH